VARRGPLAHYLASVPLAPSRTSWLKSKVLFQGDPPPRYPSSDEVDSMAFDIISKNTIVYAPGPQIVSIDFTSDNPAIASATAQAILDQFLDETLTSGKARSQVVSDFYSGQLKGAQDALSAADLAVNQYLSAHPDLRATGAVPDARLVQLQRMDTQARDTLTGFQQKVDSARLDQAALAAPGASGMRLLDPAGVPAATGAGKKVLVTALGAGLGLGALVLVLGLLVLTLADTTLRRPEEVEQALGLTLAGSVPHLAATPASKAA
jgi:uncharacterized protein involved in exopolysaccharide biosynthesis